MTGWAFDQATGLSPADYLAAIGRVFATFDARTQDSGNVSFGVEAFDRRWFVKTAGDPADPAPHLAHPERVALLENAVRIARTIRHPVLAGFHGVVGTTWGPMLVYDWMEGELLRAPPEQRDAPGSAVQRFRDLPGGELSAAIDALLEVHARLSAEGWIACDLYDGAMMYDFAGRRLRLVDLDHYHPGPFTNAMGRLFGSTRFMAPEEFELGARIDGRTTVFNLGRAISVFLGGGGLEINDFRGSPAQHAVMLRACQPAPEARYPDATVLLQAWREAGG